ncbi:MAG: rhodanese-related sulfurtransferase [Gammaproteobacteria bacterium]|jgi:rhodanese-related sulfurtransferase|tara:strand:+ start:1059 stop:1472 length:414 start_codon:yes stop_codon:yes gene_type:complete
MDRLIEFANANIWLALALVGTILAVIFNELRLRSQSIGSISAPQAVGLINNGATVVDLREADAFKQGHLIDALNLNPKELANSKKLKSNKGVLLVCENGSKSARALAELRKAGFDNSFSLKGGIAAWQQDNLPTERS